MKRKSFDAESFMASLPPDTGCGEDAINNRMPATTYGPPVHIPDLSEDTVSSESPDTARLPHNNTSTEHSPSAAHKRTSKGLTHEKTQQQISASDFEMKSLDAFDEMQPQWLIDGYIPQGQISVLAGDGGCGKTMIWCGLAAAVSSGNSCFLLGNNAAVRRPPSTVMFFSKEDSVEHVLRKRLRLAGANLKNIICMGTSDPRIHTLTFNSPMLENLVSVYKPALCIFDPIQGFIPANMHMGDRNAMRNCLAPLITLGEKYGTTFILIVHANKQAGVWGRKRMADSSDIWDISRSVLMVGMVPNSDLRYISHEKSNYGALSETVLFSASNGVPVFVSYTDQKDRDYVQKNEKKGRNSPALDEAKDFILAFLRDGEHSIIELNQAANAALISKETLKRAKTSLQHAGEISFQAKGFGTSKRYYIRKTDDRASVNPPI